MKILLYSMTVRKHYFKYTNMTLQSAVQKGKELENYVAKQIESKGLGSARRSIGSGSGNREKADIDTDMQILGRNVGFECKNYKNAAVRDWWAQAQKLEVLRREPIVAYKLSGEPYPETKVIIYLETFLELVKKGQEPKNVLFSENREAKWIVQSVITACKKLLKYLEGWYE